ncbi:Testis- and ovary-specific PAZ domain-containing protein 1 [Channa argus]|uniref:Protein TOPAZ1 n=1 Tax=Channa argus TaxID=215402 RepID=A0A6G1QY94_CHAAH|nr:Testis- and ovary-specific PAZ domain-containing protein 1 [Channa argus]
MVIVLVVGMPQSSSRVKLNRVVFKDVDALKVLPRRRRVSRSPGRLDPQKPEDKLHFSAVMPVKDTADEPNRNKRAQSLSARTRREKVSHTASDMPEGEPEENGAGTEKEKRKKDVRSWKELKHEETYTRDNKNSHLSRTGLSGKEGYLTTAVGASGCALCGDSKYIFPLQKIQHKHGEKRRSPSPEQSSVKFQDAHKTESLDTKLSKKILIWIDKYPKVTLCDLAQYCDRCSHNCGFVLPHLLENKVLHCFKKDIAGFRFGPACLGHNKHKSEKCALAKNSKLVPRVHSVERVSRYRSLTEHQRIMTEPPDTETLTSCNPTNFFKGWTGEASATCSASSLVGKCRNKGEWRTNMWNTAVEDPRPEEETQGDKRTSIGKILNSNLTSTPELERIYCNETAKPGSVDKGKTYSCVLDDSQSGVELAFYSCGSFGSREKENGVHRKLFGQLGEPRKNDAVEMSSELLFQRSEVDTNDPELFTCQRVRPFFKKMHFSCARTDKPWPFCNSGSTVGSHACTTACPADSNLINQSGTLNSQTTDILLNAPTDPSSDMTHVVSHQNAECSLGERNLERHANKSLCSPDSRNFTEAEVSVPSRLSDTAILSSPSLLETEPDTATVSAASTPVNGQETNSSISTPSPSVLGPSDWETVTTLSPMFSPFTHSGFSSLSTLPSSLPPLLILKKVKGVEVNSANFTNSSPSSPPKQMLKTLEKPLIHSEETQVTSCNSALSHSLDSFYSCQSNFPPEKQASDEDSLSDRTPPKLEPYYNSPFNLHNIPKEHCVEMKTNELMLLPLLSPVTSPQPHSRPSSMPHLQEETNRGTSKHKMLLEHHLVKYLDHKDFKEHRYEALDGIPTSSSVRDVNNQNEEETQEETEYEDDVQEVNRSSDQAPLDPKVKATLTSGVLTESSSCSSSDEDDNGVVNDEGQPPHFATDGGSSPSKITDHERGTAKAAGDTQPNVLDEFTAYEQDILLVSVIQDDPELFENLPEQSLLKLGPTRVGKDPKSRPPGVLNMLSQRPDGASIEFEQRLRQVNVAFNCDSSEITEKTPSRPWRPQYSNITSKAPNKCLITEKQARNLCQPDANNNHVSRGLERILLIETVNSSQTLPPLLKIRNGPRITNPTNMAEFRQQKSNSYCRQYFSESQSCGFKMCWFQHVPLDGDEKFCVETVMRFTKNPMCLHKAGAVFTGYYNNNPPGVYFSKPALVALLWALLKAAMVSDVFSVLNVSLAHKIVPSLEFLLALFNFVREKGLMSFVPELMQLIFKMNNAGLLDCLDGVKNTPEFQHTVCPASPTSVLSNGAPFPEYLSWAHSIVEIEFCTKQEDWRRMGEVFKSICQFSQHPNQVERISGRIAVALLSESKDKLSLPFAVFAETVCQNEGEDNLIRSFLGRIGVSLMLRYHKTHQWVKGRRVVELLSVSKVNYSTLKGLFGNEDGASRCCLVTVAAELFLLSGSVEGSLKTLRENKWFLSSSLWPCEPADLESRICVLMRLAETTSHRDTLEVLCNLPGIKEANNMIDASRYCPLFNSHLQVCVERQVLPVAADTVDFMLSKKLPVDHKVLQTLLHKLGKQNLWLRAREVFRHSLSVGYYSGVSAPTGFMSLIVPCQLGEVELALIFEMFITVNATIILQLSERSTSSLAITLKRNLSCESEYLSAGSRLLSAASIPQPKLTVHYTAVNTSQEQVFTLDISSARRWLRHNHLWANEVWLQ